MGTGKATVYSGGVLRSGSVDADVGPPTPHGRDAMTQHRIQLIDLLLALLLLGLLLVTSTGISLH